MVKISLNVKILEYDLLLNEKTYFNKIGHFHVWAEKVNLMRVYKQNMKKSAERTYANTTNPTLQIRGKDWMAFKEKFDSPGM